MDPIQSNEKREQNKDIIMSKMLLLLLLLLFMMMSVGAFVSSSQSNTSKHVNHKISTTDASMG